MKYPAIRTATVAALLAFAGSAAYAQQLNADVPFGFKTPAGGYIPAGKVAVIKSQSPTPIAVYTFHHVATGKRQLVNTTEHVERTTSDGDLKATLVFRCAGETCAIAGVYQAGESLGNGVRVKLPPPPPATQISEIRIPLVAE